MVFWLQNAGKGDSTGSLYKQDYAKKDKLLTLVNRYKIELKN